MIYVYDPSFMCNILVSTLYSIVHIFFSIFEILCTIIDAQCSVFISLFLMFHVQCKFCIRWSKFHVLDLCSIIFFHSIHSKLNQKPRQITTKWASAKSAQKYFLHLHTDHLAVYSGKYRESTTFKLNTSLTKSDRSGPVRIGLIYTRKYHINSKQSLNFNIKVSNWVLSGYGPEDTSCAHDNVLGQVLGLQPSSGWISLFPSSLLLDVIHIPRMWDTLSAI